MFRHTLHMLLLPCLLALILVGLTMTASQGQARPLPAAQSRGTLSIIAVLIGQVQRQVAIYVPNSYQPGEPSRWSSRCTATAAMPLICMARRSASSNTPNPKASSPSSRTDCPAPGAPADSNNYNWSDPVNIGFMNHLIDLMTNHFTIDSRRVYFIRFFRRRSAHLPTGHRSGDLGAHRGHRHGCRRYGQQAD